MAYIDRRTTKSGPRYEVRWRPGAGENEQSRSFPTLEAARAWKVQVEAARLQGQRLDPRAGRRQFDAYAAEWLAGRVLADRTRELYEYLIRVHVNPTFGGLPLSRITTTRVRKWHSQLAARGGVVGPRAYRVLRSILASAVEEGLIPTNPCTIRGAGSEDSPDRPFVPPVLVIELAQVAHPLLRSMILVAGFGGMRLGELRALRVRHFDEVAGRITVEESVDLKGRRKGPKTRAGERKVALHPAVVADLVEHVAAHCGGDPDGPLFPSPGGGVMAQSFHRAQWTVARRAAGAEGIHFHDLRHTAGTLTAQVGATMKEVMSRIGHSTPRAALRYQHAAEERDQEIAERMGQLVAGIEIPARAPVARLPRDRRGMDSKTREAQAEETTSDLG